MGQSTIALIILTVTLLMFLISRIPVCVSTCLGALAMWIFGIITPEGLFSGASNTATLMVLGMSIVGACLFETGIAGHIGDILISGIQRKHISEKAVVLLLYAVSGLLSVYFAGMIPLMILFPVIDCMTASSGNRMTRKNLYLPVAIASVLGGNLSSVGSSSMAAASGLVADSYVGQGFHLMDPFWLGLPGFLIVFLFYLTVGYGYQDRCLNYEEIPAADVGEIKTEQIPSWKKWIAGTATLGCVTGFVCGINIGVVAIFGAVCLMFTGCITTQKAFSSVSWETVVTIAASMALAKGINDSGAGKVIADTVLGVSGNVINSPAGMASVLLILAAFISNFMSNNAAVAILVPISLHIAKVMGADGVTFALAVAVGANLAVATPISVSCITASMSAGYNARHLLKIGGIANVLAVAATVGMLYVIL